MKIKPEGREYATWTVTASGTVTGLEVTFDDGATWTALAAVDATTFRVLVAGPDATTNPDGTVVLAAGRHFAMTRLTDNPEVIIRDGGTIDVG